MSLFKGATTIVVLLVAVLCAPPPLLAARISGSNCYPTPVRIGVGDAGPANAHLISNANIEWVRMTIRWSVVQPGPTTWNWTSTDNLVNAHYARGHKILAILSTAPPWASNVNGTRPVGTVQDTSLWEEFVRRVAQRYSGKIVAYEIWNEPDHWDVDIGVGWAGPLFANGQPNQLPYYALYVIRASQQIRAHAPGTLVVAPASRSAPTSTTVDLYRSLQQYGVAAHMDVVSLHANGAGSESSAVKWSHINSTLNTVRNRNPANLNKPVWITEFGWPNPADLQRDKIQALATRWTMSWLGANCSGNQDFKTFLAFIHTLKDGPGFTRGIHWENGSPKPVVTTYLQTLPTWAIQLPFGTTMLPYVPFTVSCAGRTCTFTSGQPTEPRRYYNWSFGDGTSSHGTSQTVTHTYAKGGHYHVFHGTRIEGGPDPDFALEALDWQSDARMITVP